MIPKQAPNPLIDLIVFLGRRKHSLADWLKENNFLTKEDLSVIALQGSFHEFKINEEALAQMIALLPDAASKKKAEKLSPDATKEEIVEMNEKAHEIIAKAAGKKKSTTPT
jgi:hypothetical protein